MQVNSQTATWLRRIFDGYPVVDLGQLSANTLRVLRKLTKSGQLVRATFIGFPVAKNCWVGAGLARAEWPANVFENDPRKSGAHC